MIVMGRIITNLIAIVFVVELHPHHLGDFHSYRVVHPLLNFLMLQIPYLMQLSFCLIFCKGKLHLQSMEKIVTNPQRLRHVGNFRYTQFLKQKLLPLSIKERSFPSSTQTKFSMSAFFGVRFRGLRFQGLQSVGRLSFRGWDTHFFFRRVYPSLKHNSYLFSSKIWKLLNLTLRFLSVLHMNDLLKNWEEAESASWTKALVTRRWPRKQQTGLYRPFEANSIPGIWRIILQWFDDSQNQRKLLF